MQTERYTHPQPTLLYYIESDAIPDVARVQALCLKLFPLPPTDGCSTKACLREHSSTLTPIPAKRETHFSSLLRPSLFLCQSFFRDGCSGGALLPQQSTRWRAPLAGRSLEVHDKSYRSRRFLFRCHHRHTGTS